VNVIILFVDSFRQDHVSVYGRQAPFENVPACKTPNLDKFAQECVVFDNAYPEGLPTMPVRLAVMTGQYTLPFRGWEPLIPQDITMTRILRESGYICGMIADTYHFRRAGYNYHENFDSYAWVRGQEYDPWVSSTPRRDISDYVNENYDETWRKRISQFLANTDDFTREEDWFPAKVVDETVRWLKANRGHKDVFLWMDSFDPHEPWDPPGRFDTYTDPDYSGPRLIMPMGGPCKTWATPEQVRLIQGLYAGEAAFVDHCLGRLFEALRELGYMDDSLIILTADHGHPLGDHGRFLKGGDRMYSELLHIPFMVHLPGGGNGGRRTDALVQFHDILPTVLDALGRSNDTDAMHGRSFLPVLKGDEADHRDAIIVGYHRAPDRCIRDKVWTYIERPGDDPDELYNLAEDPRETRNLIDEHPEEARGLARHFGDLFRTAPRPRIKGIQGQYEMGSSALE